MIEEMQFTLIQWPPTVNHYYITTKSGMRIMTKAAKIWQDYAVGEIQEQMRLKSSIAVPYVRIDEPCQVIIDLWQPTRAMFDVDNRAKPILDALENADALENDNLVYKLTMTKHIPPHKTAKEVVDARRGEVDIVIKEL